MKSRDLKLHWRHFENSNHRKKVKNYLRIRNTWDFFQRKKKIRQILLFVLFFFFPPCAAFRENRVIKIQIIQTMNIWHFLSGYTSHISHIHTFEYRWKILFFGKNPKTSFTKLISFVISDTFAKWVNKWFKRGNIKWYSKLERCKYTTRARFNDKIRWIFK